MCETHSVHIVVMLVVAVALILLLGVCMHVLNTDMRTPLVAAGRGTGMHACHMNNKATDITATEFYVAGAFQTGCANAVVKLMAERADYNH